MIRKMVLCLAVVAGIFGGAFGQEKSPGGRYYAPNRTEMESAKSDLDSQRRELKQQDETNRRYVRWFDESAGRMRSGSSEIAQLSAGLDTLKKGWNTRANPTCDNGHTYATCSCARGASGKTRYRDVVARQGANLNRAIRTQNAEIAAYKRNRVAYDSFLSRKNQAYARYNESVRRYNEMLNKNQGGSTDEGRLTIDGNAEKKK